MKNAIQLKKNVQIWIIFMNILSDEHINKIFELAEITMPEDITTNDISKALIEIEQKLTVCTLTLSKITPENSQKILIIDDLEVSIHQLKLLLNKSGYNVVVARTVEEAIQEIKKQEFKHIFIDLFMPDSQDGLDLLKFIKSPANTSKDYKAIVISGTEDKKLINKCFELGADEFISKSLHWHKDVLSFINQDKNKLSKKSYAIEIEDQAKNIISVTPLSLSNENIVFDIEKTISLQVNTGNKNVIFDCINITSLEPISVSLIISAYKICSEAKGHFVISNASESILKTLEDLFLSNAIKTYIDKNTALKSLQSL